MNTKTALILAGTSDIGRAIAEYLAVNGWDLVLTGRNKDYMDRIATDLQIRTKSRVKTYYFDACDFKSHEKFYQSIDPSPNICVCAFGYLGSQENAQINWDETGKIIDVNFKGAVSILNLVAEDFAHRKQGTIVGISSVAGDRGRQGNYIYGSAKAAFTTYLSGLRNRMFKHGVHVIAIKPGFVETKMTEHMKLPKFLTASPADVATAVCRAVDRKMDNLYVLGVWKYIMLLIKILPEWIFKRTKL